MEIFETIFSRRSIRKFLEKPVEEEKIRKILEAATFAPSAGNTQEWRFIKIKNSHSSSKGARVLRRQSLKSQIAEAALGQMFIAQAPVVIVVCADLLEIEMAYGDKGKELYSLLDCGMAAQNLMLAATAEGLGTCPVGAFDEEEIKEILDLPENLRPVLIIPVGYPAEKPEKTPRKSLEKVVVER